ncbi:hypothetical protein BDR04DRAFT_823302 [Suillus decipiens]|nr:hypothetical protein BDR04DRAFT_823302 [Suillus decipiens]
MLLHVIGAAYITSHHITMAISTTLRQYYIIPLTHYNQPRQLPLHHRPPHPSYLILRFCLIKLRVRQPRAISKFIHRLRVVSAHNIPARPYDKERAHRLFE